MKEKRNSAKEWYEEASASGDEMMLSRAESAMMTFVECILTIKNLSSVTPKRKTGKWIDGQCSICGCDTPAYIIDWKWQKDMDANFCPICGADMRQREENK